MSRLTGAEDLAALKLAFHDTHKAIFEISDRHSEVEFVTWRARVRCRLCQGDAGRVPRVDRGVELATRRQVYRIVAGWVAAKVVRFVAMWTGEPVTGSEIILHHGRHRSGTGGAANRWQWSRGDVLGYDG